MKYEKDYFLWKRSTKLVKWRVEYGKVLAVNARPSWFQMYQGSRFQGF